MSLRSLIRSHKTLLVGLTLALLAGLSASAGAQTAGDYRSAATGNWNAIATWERFNGTTWVAAATAPASTDGVITIRSVAPALFHAPLLRCAADNTI